MSCPERISRLQDHQPPSNQHHEREPTEERHRQVVALTVEINSRRRAISCSWHGNQSAFTISGESDAGLQIVASEIRKIFKDLFFRHVGSQIFQDLIDGDSQSTNTRFATAFVWVNCDLIPVIHLPTLWLND